MLRRVSTLTHGRRGAERDERGHGLGGHAGRLAVGKRRNADEGPADLLRGIWAGMHGRSRCKCHERLRSAGFHRGFLALAAGGGRCNGLGGGRTDGENIYKLAQQLNSARRLDALRSELDERLAPGLRMRRALSRLISCCLARSGLGGGLALGLAALDLGHLLPQLHSLDLRAQLHDARVRGGHLLAQLHGLEPRAQLHHACICRGRRRELCGLGGRGTCAAAAAIAARARNLGIALERADELRDLHGHSARVARVEPKRLHDHHVEPADEVRLLRCELVRRVAGRADVDEEDRLASLARVFRLDLAVGRARVLGAKEANNGAGAEDALAHGLVRAGAARCAARHALEIEPGRKALSAQQRHNA